MDYNNIKLKLRGKINKKKKNKNIFSGQVLNLSTKLEIYFSSAFFK